MWHSHLIKPLLLDQKSKIKNTITHTQRESIEKNRDTNNSTRMPEFKDTAIKLFGKRILLPVNHHVLANHSFSAATAEVCYHHELTTSFHEENSTEGGEDQEEDREPSEKESEDKQEDGTSQQIIEDSKDYTTSSGISENPETPSVDREASSLKSSKNGEQNDTSVSQERTLKKPDKIIPCPRCNSMDTKFCYYNNYNVNQPRHFCKNCQRYWTAGGTMRNVPVGAGRRKNKNSSALHYRHVMVSEALRTAQVNAANGVHNPSLGKNGTVLTFGSDSPLCESVASVLNLSEKSQNYVLNGFHRPEQRILVGCGGADNGDDHSSRSSITASNSSEKSGGNAGLQEAMVKNYQGFPPQVPCFPATPWSYSWNSAQWNSAMPPPAFCPSGFPVSFYPAPPYWGCTVPAPWNVPCLSSTSSSLNHCAQSSGPTSLTLGKHSRDGNILSPANIEKDEPLKENNITDQSVLVPKTLRIDDPSEAAKSSILATLGIKSNKTNSINGGGLFKGFQSKGGDKNHVAETSPLLQANPAALSRSLNFHENT